MPDTCKRICTRSRVLRRLANFRVPEEVLPYYFWRGRERLVVLHGGPGQRRVVWLCVYAPVEHGHVRVQRHCGGNAGREEPRADAGVRVATPGLCARSAGGGWHYRGVLWRLFTGLPG